MGPQIVTLSFNILVWNPKLSYILAFRHFKFKPSLCIHIDNVQCVSCIEREYCRLLLWLEKGFSLRGGCVPPASNELIKPTLSRMNFWCYNEFVLFHTNSHRCTQTCEMEPNNDLLENRETFGRGNEIWDLWWGVFNPFLLCLLKFCFMF